MSKVYTLEQLEQLHKFALDHSLYTDSFNTTRDFLDMIKLRELKLMPPRDENGRFIKSITNEDIYEAIINPSLKE